MIYSPGDAAPFMLQSKLREQGARFQAGAAWGPFVVTDRNLITGQNPASAAEVARQVEQGTLKRIGKTRGRRYKLP